MKTVVVYAFHEYNRNVTFFMEKGMTANNDVDYIVVQNVASQNSTVSKTSEITQDDQHSKLTWIKRPNVSQDWGAYSEAIRHFNDSYKYFVFLNSTMRGPFVPPCSKNTFWTEFFTKRLNDDVALVGSTINPYFGQPHVQSMLMVMDKRVLDIAVEQKKFFDPIESIPKKDLILGYEVGLSTTVLQNGYNIDCLVQAFQNIDWRKNPKINMPITLHESDLWGDRNYFGYNLHAYETIFFKTNRDYESPYCDLELRTILDENSTKLEPILSMENNSKEIERLTDFVKSKLVLKKEKEDLLKLKHTTKTWKTVSIITISLLCAAFLLILFSFLKK